MYNSEMKKRQQHASSHRLLQYLLLCVSIILFHIVLFETEHSCQMEKDLNITVVEGIIQWSCRKSYIKKEERKGRGGNREREM